MVRKRGGEVGDGEGMMKERRGGEVGMVRKRGEGEVWDGMMRERRGGRGRGWGGRDVRRGREGDVGMVEEMEMGRER